MQDVDIALYPIYVLIWDDKSFKKVFNSKGLRYFEEADLREGPHLAWDQLGRKYEVVWSSELRHPVLILTAEQGIDALRQAIGDYQDRLRTHGMLSPPHNRCDPTCLLDFLSRIEGHS